MIIKTRNGLDFFEVSSSFQKSLRRGLEDEAMSFAVELHESGYGEYMWKRMQVVATEDVGLAEPMIFVQIRTLHGIWREQKKEDKTTGKTTHRLYVAHAVLLLARCKKSRLVDHFNIWHFRNQDAPIIPDFALDKHTRRGKRLGRGLGHFFEEGAKLANMGEVDREAEFLDKAVKRLSEPPKAPVSETPKSEQGKLL